MKKNKIIGLVLIVGLCTFIAIVFINSNSKKKIKDEKTKLVFESFEELKEEVSNYKYKTYDNLKIEAKLNEIQADNLYIYEQISSNTLTMEDVKPRALAVFERFTGYEMKEEYYSCEINQSEDPSSAEKAVGNDVSLCIIEDGNEVASWLGLYMNAANMDLTTYDAMIERSNQRGKAELIFVDRDYDHSLAYDVLGENYRIEDAVAFAKNYMDEFGIVKDWDERFTVKPYAVVVFPTTGPDVEEKGKETTFFYLVCFEYYIDGIAVNSTGANEKKRETYPEKYLLTIQIDKKNHVGHILNRFFSLCSDGEKVENEVLSLDSCLSMVSDYLAEESNYTVTDIDIKYVNMHFYNEKSELKPFWKVVLRESAGDLFSPVNTRAIYVDMMTGDMYLYDDASDSMLGMKIWNEEGQ